MKRLFSVLLILCLAAMTLPVQNAQAFDLWGLDLASASSGSALQYWLSTDAAANFAFFGSLGLLTLGVLAAAAYEMGQAYQMETMRKNLYEAGCREDGNGGWICPDVQSGR